jgi:hypothetical protein
MLVFGRAQPMSAFGPKVPLTTVHRRAIAGGETIAEYSGVRLRPYFGDTYAGIITIGVGGASACALLSVAMYLFRPFFEPILRIALVVTAGYLGGHFVYRSDQYWLWDGYAALLGLFILGMAAVVMIRKPAQDRQIDGELRRQTTEYSHGAPLEP